MIYRDAAGNRVSQSAACFAAGRTRPGYAAILEDGETLDTSKYLFLNDARLADAKPADLKSADDHIRAAFKERADFKGLSVEEWLKTTDTKDITSVATYAITQMLSAKAGEGVAKAFGDATPAQIRDAALANRYAREGSGIAIAGALNMDGMSAEAMRNAARDNRYA